MDSLGSDNSLKTFDDVTSTQKETAAVLAISLTFILVLVGSMAVPYISSENLLRDPMFYMGSIVFGLIGFLAMEILTSLAFLGDGAKFGAAGFVLILVIAAWIGGSYTLAFLSGSLVGLSLFYVKSIFAIARILIIETRKEEPMLTLTEMAKTGDLNTFMIEGIGANFELLYYILDELKGKSNVMFYARIINMEQSRLDQILGDTMRFYSNHMLPLHRVDSKRTSRIIKQMCFECTSPEIIERGLINYWLRAHLNGGYTCVLVPYDDNFLEKAAACEGSLGERLDINKIIGDESWLVKMDSLMGDGDSHIVLYTRMNLEEAKDQISKVHPVD